VSEAVLAAAGREWTFKLTIGQWMRLQSRFGKVGPMKISQRLSGDDWTIEEVIDIIERGLEGGGMAASEAKISATEIVEGQPLLQSYALAGDILGAAFAGLDELLKKKEEARLLAASLSKIAMGNGGGTTFSDAASKSASSPPKPSSSPSPNISA
jgi:hypothetical protein